MDLNRRHALAVSATVLSLSAGCLEGNSSEDNEADENGDSDNEASQGELSNLLTSNKAHTDEISDDYFEAVLDGQQPPVVSICCSDSRVSQEGMWNGTEPGWLFAPSNIGNVVWDEYDDEQVVDGSVLFPVANTGTKIVAVVGHSRCGAIRAAYQAVTKGELPDQPGIKKRIELLMPVIEDGLEDDVIDTTGEDTEIVGQLVEYNVHQQVEFLLNDPALSEDVDVYGFVYDFHGTHGEVRGRTYLVNANGESDTAELQALLSETHGDYVASVLDENPNILSRLSTQV